MVVLPVLSIATYGAAVVGHHPEINAPDAVEKFSGFLRIASVILLLLGFVVGLTSFNTGTLGMSVLALIVVGLLATYDYMIVAKKARDSAKESVAKAGKEYLETKKEIEKGPDQVTNVQGDAVGQKTQQTHVDQSTTNVDQIDQSTTNVDQSRTVNDQRTQVEDSVVNRSDISAADETAAPQGGRQQPPQQQPRQNQPSQQQPNQQPQNQPSQQQPNQQPQNQPSQQQPNQQRPPQEREVEANPRNRGGQPGGQGGQPTGQQGGGSQPAEQTGAGGGGGEYCPECGEEITAGWSNCISCGAEL